MSEGINMIENIYTDYGNILEEFTEEAIDSRYAVLYQEMKDFVRIMKADEMIRLDESVLIHVVLDYFTDISRLKKFHQVKHVSSLKVLAYESYWLLRRKPMQIVKRENIDESLVFINEKFVFSRISKYLLGDGKNVILSPEHKKGLMSYLDSLLYFLKYRDYDAQMLEMMLLGFKTGVLIADDIKASEEE